MRTIKWIACGFVILAIALGYAVFADFDLFNQPKEESLAVALESKTLSADAQLSEQSNKSETRIASKVENLSPPRNADSKRAGHKTTAAERDQDMRERIAAMNLARFEAALAGNADESMRAYMMLENCSYGDKFESGPMKHYCSGVTPAMIAARYELLSLAAESGAIEARLAYARSIHFRYSNLDDIVNRADEVLAARNTAIRYLNESAQSGSPEALMALSREYSQGFLVKKDLVLSRAYHYAASLTGKYPLPNTQSWMGTQYGPADLAATEQMAREIFQKCCK